MGDAAGQSAERLELGRGQAFVFDPLPVRHIADESRHAAAARVGMDLEPFVARNIAGFELHPPPLLHDLAVMRFKNGPERFREHFPENSPEHFFARTSEELLEL